jgi:lipoprotein-anchoring transpeptidase ErfK/SrfK
VPWVLFFHKAFGFHGAFWHNDFGRVRSHGCVNLAPRDAAWLYAWAGPEMPVGWSAVLPSPSHPGTLVRVR